jgi:alpha,alpha-trehalase
LNRRQVLVGATGILVASRTFAAPEPTAADGSQPQRAELPGDPDRQEWQKLDTTIRGWWDEDTIHATEKEIRADSSGQLLFLPAPYLRISVGAAGTYQAQFPFDTAFMNYALFAHGRTDLVRSHILNHIFLIKRYGYCPNANYSWLLTRSQSSFVPSTIWRYYTATRDLDLLYMAYPLLKQEYRQYWNASHHQTPIGLATCRDLGDPSLSPILASEAETSLDWMPVYNGDIRRCAPLSLNCALVSYARALALISKEVGRDEEAREFAKDADKRTALVQKYCWSEELGLFLEYDYVAGEQLPYISECAYWTLWSGVATRKQAARLVANLHLLEQPYGLACTDRAYPDPHSDETYLLKNMPYARLQDMPPQQDSPPEYLGGRGPLMWMYPAGWASTQLLVAGGLDAYGYGSDASRIATRYLSLLLMQYKKTGQLWEKYNVVDGSLVLPNSRYGNIPYHSFTAAAVVLFGRRVFEGQPLRAI